MGAAAVAKDKTKSIKDLSIYRWRSSDLFSFVLGFHPRINVAFPFCCDVAVLAHVRADVKRPRKTTLKSANGLPYFHLCSVLWSVLQ